MGIFTCLYVYTLQWNTRILQVNVSMNKVFKGHIIDFFSVKFKVELLEISTIVEMWLNFLYANMVKSNSTYC